MEFMTSRKMESVVNVEHVAVICFGSQRKRFPELSDILKNTTLKSRNTLLLRFLWNSRNSI